MRSMVEGDRHLRITQPTSPSTGFAGPPPRAGEVHIRIIAGKWRGRPLKAPPGQATRPTSDRAREALFSMLASRIGSFEGLKVCDLFAGTGALGLEALSRGAAHCIFVETDHAALEALKANVVAFSADAAIRAQAAEHFSDGPFDLVFADPPYRSGLGQRALANIALASGGWISLETARDEPVLIDGLTVEAERIYGKAKLTLLRVR